MESLTIILGFIGTVEYRELPGKDEDGKPKRVFSFTVATERKGKDNTKVTTWWKVSAWGALADVCRDLEFKAGTLVYVRGVAAVEVWKDEKGDPRATLRLHPDKIRKAERKPAELPKQDEPPLTAPASEE